MSALQTRVENLAREVARLPDGWERDRIVGEVLTLDMMVQPTAAERVAEGMPVGAALALIDQRDEMFRRIFG